MGDNERFAVSNRFGILPKLRRDVFDDVQLCGQWVFVRQNAPIDFDHAFVGDGIHAEAAGDGAEEDRDELKSCSLTAELIREAIEIENRLVDEGKIPSKDKKGPHASETGRR